MLRIVFSVIAGFIAWLIMWIGGEMILSALWPEGFGVHQRAFQEAIEKGGPFTAVRTLLVVHLVLVPVVSTVAGFLAAVIAGENKWAPMVLGFLLLAMGFAKMVMTWSFVPIWYHVLFTGSLVLMPIVGGKLKASIGKKS
jgi:hypothetical protein